MSLLISRDLAVALMETVVQHAETHHGGKMEVDRTLSAIGDLASGFLAEIDRGDDCLAHFSAMVSGIRTQMLLKRAQDGAVRTRQ